MQLRLILVAILLFAGYFALPTNYRVRQSMEMYVTGFPQEWAFYRRNLDPDKRERKYNQLNFEIPLNLKRLLREGDVAVIPPEQYLRRYFPEAQLRWAEPRFIVYAAGAVRTVPWEEASFGSVTHGILVEMRGRQPQIKLKPIRNQKDFEDLAQAYERDPAS